MESLSRIVALVGPAGAGKTTLFQALGQRSECILLGFPPFARNLVASPFYVRQALLLMPTLVHLHRNKNNSRSLTRREIALMAILNGWPRLLRQEMEKHDKVVVLDQGPVIMMVQLHMLGPESLRSRIADKWWKSVYRQWATSLDIVVYLDASDTHLLHRIRTRGDCHAMKDKPVLKVFDFLAHYRMAYEQVLSFLTAKTTGPMVLRFDTARESVDSIVTRLLSEFGLTDGRDEVVR